MKQNRKRDLETQAKLFRTSDPQTKGRPDYPVRIGYVDQVRVKRYCVVCKRETMWAASYGRPLYCFAHRTPDPRLVCLTELEQAWAQDMATNLRRRGVTNKWVEGNEDDAQLVGTLTEVAFAKLSNLAVPHDYLERIGFADFGTQLGVRGTRRLVGPRLRVKPADDSNSVYVLGVIFPRDAANPDGAIRFHAWAWGKDVKRHCKLEDPGDRGVPAHFATMSSSFMHFDLDEIPRSIWDNCERGYKPWWGER